MAWIKTQYHFTITKQYVILLKNKNIHIIIIYSYIIYIYVCIYILYYYVNPIQIYNNFTNSVFHMFKIKILICH